MSRLGRDLRRCVLVDDTPLAFFRQPDHGIPILQVSGQGLTFSCPNQPSVQSVWGEAC